MFQNYTISIIHNKEENVPPFSAKCEEFDIITDDFSIPAALSALFSAIKILENESSKTENTEYFFKDEITFKIPLAA